MKAFKTHKGIVAPLDLSHVDTDQIIPKQFLKRIDRSGFGDALFHDWRFDVKKKEKPDFILNREPYRKAGALLARENFGCGSSREHAVWALMDFGMRVIIAESYADIFRNNALGNGLLLVTFSKEEISEILGIIQKEPGEEAETDLEAQTLKIGEKAYKFEIPKFHKNKLLKGLDDIAWTLTQEKAISDYEKKRSRKKMGV